LLNHISEETVNGQRLAVGGERRNVYKKQQLA
jgi:hypothetical protein